MHDERDPRRERIARLLLAPLLLAIVVAAPFAPWHTVWGVDNRTYLEMADGVRQHGLPYTTNGAFDFDRHPEARAPFNTPSHGKLWGEYPPLFPYVGAAALALGGGVSGIWKLNTLLLAALAVSTFRLARRVVRDPLAGVAAAYLVVLSTPVWVVGFVTFAQPLMLALLPLAADFAVASAEDAGARGLRLALLAGVTGGLAVAAHLLAFPLVFVLLVALAFVGREGGDWKRSASAAGGLALVLAPMSLLNAYRFGTANPLSYGHCIWNNCKLTTDDDLSMSAMLRWALPGIAWCAALVAALLLLRSWRARAVAIAVAGLALVPHGPVQDRVFRMASTLYGYAIDLSPLDIRLTKTDFPWFFRAPDGLGNMHIAGSVLKSSVQCTPVLALAALAPMARRGDRARALLCALPVAGLAAHLSLLAIFDGAAAFGWPYLYCRYALPAVPMLATLAVLVARELPWRVWHGIVLAAVAVAGIVYYTRHYEDGPYVRRWLELRASLIVAALAVAGVAIARRRSSWRQIACVPVAVAAAAGVACAVGVDGLITVTGANNFDAISGRFAELTPARFAVVGWGGQLDPLLSLKGSRDVEYLDFGETRDEWTVGMREAADVWARDGRPVFGVFGHDFEWPLGESDLPAHVIDAEHGFWSIGPPCKPAPPRGP